MGPTEKTETRPSGRGCARLLSPVSRERDNAVHETERSELSSTGRSRSTKAEGGLWVYAESGYLASDRWVPCCHCCYRILAMWIQGDSEPVSRLRIGSRGCGTGFTRPWSRSRTKPTRTKNTRRHASLAC